MKTPFIRLTVGKKLAAGYGVLLLITLINCCYVIYIIRENQKLDRIINEVYQPQLNLLADLRQEVIRAQQLSSNWIYLPNDAHKAELEIIQSSTLPLLVSKIRKQFDVYGSEDNAITDRLTTELRNMTAAQKEIMELLRTNQDYFDSQIITKAIFSFDNRIKPAEHNVSVAIADLSKILNARIHELILAKDNAINNVQLAIIISLFFCLIIGTTAAILSTRSVIGPIGKLRKSILALSQGELKEISIDKRNDEIGDMIESTNLLVLGLRKTTEFTERIANGDLEDHGRSLSNIKTLDEALLRMKDSLVTAAAIEERRNWVTNGVAKVSLILHRINDVESMAEEVIRQLVEYTGSCSGGIFVSGETQNPHEMYLLSSYAMENTSENRVIKFGEGLAGQVWKDGKIFHAHGAAVAHSITSAMGRFMSTSLAIIPLQVNGRTFGIVELSSFANFEEHGIRFLGQVCENISSALMASITARETSRLLEQSQIQTEQLRAQEEEIRQMLIQAQTHTEKLLSQEKEMLSMLEQSTEQTRQLKEQEEVMTHMLLASQEQAELLLLREKDLRSSREVLEETVKVNSKLLSLISHDIRGPFASIKGLIQMFNNGLVSVEELAVHLSKIENLVSSTDLLFTNIMQWSNHYSGGTAITREKLSLRKIIDSNIKFFNGSIHEKGNKIHVDVGPHTLINGNETIMNLVFKNLISNANKFTENGMIRFSHDATNNILTIQDDGVGMTTDQLTSLFNWEIKISTLGTRLEKGAGVGLLICKEFLEKMGAHLSCDSKLGEGTTVTIRFSELKKRTKAVPHQYKESAIQ